MKNLLSTSLLAAAAIVGTSFSVSAQEWMDLELNKEYKLEKGTYFYGKYTAQEDGILTVWGSEGSQTACTDPNSIGNITIPGWQWAGFPAHYTFTAKAGQSYYFSNISSLYSGPLSTNGTFRIEAVPEAAVTSTNPAEGSYIAPSGYAQIIVNFNMAPSFEKVTMSANGQSVVLNNDLCHVAGSAIGIEYKEALYNWLSSDSVKRGDEITFTIEGVRVNGELLNGEGVVTLKFVCAGMPIQFVNVEAPAELLSYIPLDASAEAGTVVFNFDGEVGSAQVDLRAGFVSEDESMDGHFYMEDDIPYTIEGNKIIVDLRGRSRRLAEMFPIWPTYNPGHVTVRVAGVADKDGMIAYSPNQGGFGVFEKNIDYRQLEMVDPLCRFTPANGASLEDVDNMRIWFSPYSKFTWDGIRFDYKDAEGNAQVVVVPAEQVAVTPGDPVDDDATVQFAVPAEVKNAKDVVVTFDNLVCTDGNDHTDVLKATYNGFVVTEVTPIDGSKLTSLPEGSFITMKNNLAATNPDLYVLYEIKDLNATNPDEAVVASGYMTRQEDGSYSAEIVNEITLWRFHDYAVTFTAFASEADTQNGNWKPIGTQTITYTGLTEPYKFSSVNFVSIEPAADSTIAPDQNVFTLTFDGLVEFNEDLTFINLGPNGEAKFEKIEALDPSEGAEQFSPTWAVTVPADQMKPGMLSLSFKAYDMDGKLVMGNEGVDAESYLHFDYTIVEKAEPGEVKVVTDPAEGEVEALPTRVKLTFIDQTDVMPADAMGAQVEAPMLLFMKGGETLPAPEMGGMDELNVAYQSIPGEYTEPGTYKITYPEGTFYFGSEANIASPAFTLTWTVKEGGQVDPGTLTVSTDPATGKVEVLTDKIQLIFPDYSSVVWADFNGVKVDQPTLKVGDETITLDYPTYPDDWSAPLNQLQQNLPQEYTEAGVYEIFYPASSFLFNDSFELASPEFTLTWLIGDVAVNELYGDKGNTLNVYTADGVKVLENGNADDIKALEKGLYIINGKKVILR